MLKSKKLGGPALMLAAALFLAACGGAGTDTPQNGEGAEPAQVETMTEPAGDTDSEIGEMAVAEEAGAEGATDEIVAAEEKMPAEEEIAAETEPAGESEPAAEEMVETEPEPMLEETELVEADEPSPQPEEEIANQDEGMAEEMVETKPGPTEEQRQLLQSLKVLGSPAELHNEVWLNSEPLKLADLRGQVAIVEFWTFG